MISFRFDQRPNEFWHILSLTWLANKFSNFPFSIAISNFDFPFLHYIYFSTAQICLICDQFEPEGQREREVSLSLSLMQSAWNGNGIWQSITQNAMQHMSAMSWSLKLHYTHVCTCIYVYIYYVCVCSTCPNKSDQSWVAPAHNEHFNGERSLKLFE